MIQLKSTRYEVRRSLGAGGMGVVYAAYDSERQQEVALKTLRRLDPAAVYRFKREFRALASTRHPNLVSLYELVAEDDQVFFTMELVDGSDFLRYVGHPTWPGADTETGDPSLAGADLPAPLPLRPPRNLASEPSIAPPADSTRPWESAVDGPTREPTPLSRGADRTTAKLPAVDVTLAAARLLPARVGFDGQHLAGVSEGRLRHAMRQLVDAVQALHDLGCLHRDIKPSNVLVTGEGRLVLLDLGLVTWTAPSEASVERYVAGTAAYMSPEQAAAKPLTEASDWYSVGIMLYEALTGTRPFRGTFDQIVSAKQVGEAPPPSRIVEGIPEDLENLCIDLLSYDPEKRPTGRQITDRLGPSSLPPTALGESGFVMPALPRASAFLGREDELSVLRAAYAQAVAGRCCTLHLHGASGMGKSALLRSFLDEISGGRDRAVILLGRCYERESVPFKAVDGLVDSVSRYLRGMPRVRAEALLPRDVALLARLFPVLRQVEAIALSKGRAAELQDPRELRRRAFRALRELLHRIGSRRPLILCVDDLQWGDLDSSQLLADLTRAPDPPPLLLIVSYRSADLHNSRHLELLRRAQGLVPKGSAPGVPVPVRGDSDEPIVVQELVVEPLGREECHRLALDLLGTDDEESRRQAAAIGAESQGNPYFVHELVRFVRSEGSALQLKEGSPGDSERPRVRFARRVRMEDLLRSRLATLPEQARAMLETLAVAGRPLPRSVAAQAAGIERGELDVLDVLWGAHLVRTRDTGFEELVEPYHDRIREAIVEELPGWLLRERHLRLALALEGTRAPDPEALAEHFCGAGHLEKAGDHAVVAAEQAGVALAFDRSAMLYRFAMRLMKPDAVARAGLRSALAEALAQAGRSLESAQVFVECVAETAGTEQLQHRLRSAEEYLRAGHVEEGLTGLKEVLEAFRMKVPEKNSAAVASLLLRRARVRLRGLGWKERPVESLSPLEAARIDACWTAASGLGLIDPIRAADFQTRNLLLSLASGDPPRIARSLAMEAIYHSTASRAARQRSEAPLREAAALAARLGDPKLRGLATFAAGFCAYEAGDWRKARDLHEQAETTYIDSCSGVTLEVASNRHFLILALLQLGELQELCRRIPDYVADAEDRGDRFTATSFRNGCMNIAWLVEDDPRGARRALERAMEPWAPKPFYLQHYEALFAHVTVDLYEGKGSSAWRRVQRDWPELKRAHLLNVQQLHLEALFFRGRAALSAAAHGDAGPCGDPSIDDWDLPPTSALLAEASACAARMDREKMGWALPLAAVLRAGVACQGGRADEAIAHLGDAVAALDLQDMRLYAAAARRRRGELIDGKEGRGAVERAEAWFLSQGVCDPEAMTELFAPGLRREDTAR